MTRHAIFVAAALLNSCGSCDNTRDAPLDQGTAAPLPQPSQSSRPEVAQQATAAQQPRPSFSAGTSRDIHGLSVTLLDEGRIRVVGADRWGKAFDTTYSNVTYLRNALPVLARTLPENQSKGLDAFVAELPPGPELPTPPTPAPSKGP